MCLWLEGGECELGAMEPYNTTLEYATCIINITTIYIEQLDALMIYCSKRLKDIEGKEIHASGRCSHQLPTLELRH
jgi:hypothetical protein